MLAWIGGSKRRLRSQLHKRPRVAGITIGDHPETNEQLFAGLQEASRGKPSFAAQHVWSQFWLK
jgi:hypothetical protein